MERLKQEYESELGQLITDLVATRMYEKAITLLEFSKETFSMYEHYKGIIRQEYRR